MARSDTGADPLGKSQQTERQPGSPDIRFVSSLLLPWGENARVSLDLVLDYSGTESRQGFARRDQSRGCSVRGRRCSCRQRVGYHPAYNISRRWSSATLLALHVRYPTDLVGFSTDGPQIPSVSLMLYSAIRRPAESTAWPTDNASQQPRSGLLFFACTCMGRTARYNGQAVPYGIKAHIHSGEQPQIARG